AARLRALEAGAEARAVVHVAGVVHDVTATPAAGGAAVVLTLRDRSTRDLRAGRRASALEAVAAVLSRRARADELAPQGLRPGIAALGASAAGVGLVDGDFLELLGTAGYPGPSDRWRHLPLDSPTPLAEVVRTGAPVLLASRAEALERFPVMAEASLPQH